MHDPLDIFDLVHDELDQAAETGHDVSRLRGQFATCKRSDVDRLESIWRELETLAPPPQWSYVEPDDLDAIVTELAPDPLLSSAPQLDPSTVADKIHGGWLGRIAGCNLGKPVEQGEHWTAAHLRDYLQLADAWPLSDYIPILDPLPPGFEFRENWTETTRGRVHGSARDDDIDYAILALHLLERHGTNLSRHDVAHGWLTLLPYLQVYTAERATYRNLLQGVPVVEAAGQRNPYREWIGALIRGDVFGWTNPGRPLDAIIVAYEDAALSHIGNGIYGELWAAAIVSSAFTATSVRDAYDRSLLYVPSRSRLFEALDAVRSLRDGGATWDDALLEIQRRWGHYSWVHTINNAAIIAAGLLWGDGDYTATVGLTVQGGWDTDSNGATAGSVAGVLLGAGRLPDHFIAPLDDRVRSALFGFDHSSISALAARTAAIASETAQRADLGRGSDS